MYELEKRFRFEAAHVLPNQGGKCARLHGHSWQMVVRLHGHFLKREGPSEGMLVDFGDVSALVAPIVEKYLDHHFLNETTGLANPTSEELAKWAFNLIYAEAGARALAGFVDVRDYLASVRIEETCTSAATYLRGPV